MATKNDFQISETKLFTHELIRKSYSGGKTSVGVVLLMSCLNTCHSETIDEKIRTQFHLPSVNQIWNPLHQRCF